MAVWSQYLPASVNDNLDVYLEKILEINNSLPLYKKLGAAAVVLGLLAWLGSRGGKKRKLPPGPRGIPFLGAVTQFGQTFHEDLMRLRGVYGNVFSFNLAGSLWVAVSGYPAVKEAFVKRAEDFAGRPLFGFDELFPFQDQIFMAEYNDQWKVNKKFAVVTLRNFGFGSPRLENKVLEEISWTLDKIKEEKGKGFEMIKFTGVAMARVILSITLFGDRDPTDDETENLCRILRDLNQQNAESSMGAAVMFLPIWLTKIIYKSDIVMNQNVYQDLFDMFKERIETHRPTLDPDSPRDVADMYIAKRLDKDMTMKELVDTIFIFIPDAVETLSQMLNLVFLYITHNPEVQVKIHEELDRVVGRTGHVTMNHKNDLPYLQAALLEVDRIADATPLAAPHKAITDVTFMGYDIPKDTVMLPNLHSVHFDEDIFPNPHKFDPNHFLDNNGQVKNAEYCIPFSVGRRMCMGEALAKMEKFLFAANLYQQFSFSFPPEEPNPTLEKIAIGGIFFLAKPYKICATPRS